MSGGDGDAVEGLAPEDGGALTVEEVNERVAAAVDAPDLRDVRVVGEVTDPSETDTALYFTLTDGDAELDCVLWQSRYRSMDAEIAAGAEVLVTGRVDYWVEGGRLNLKPWSVTVVGEGSRARRIARLRAELDERGWFADEHKTAPPRFPDRVGVVTSRDGDARRDVETSIHDRNPAADVVLCHASVQGDRAPAEIADAVHRLDRRGAVDCIVVGRGGGSETDLDAFDTELVAEAVFTAETPVVAAVGHTDDDTIVGAVADVDAITPTEAGTVVAPVAETRERVGELASRLDAAYRRRVDRRLAGLSADLDAAAAAATDSGVDSLAADLERAFDRRVATALRDLDAAMETAFGRLAAARLSDLDSRLSGGYRTATVGRLDRLERRLDTAYRRRVDRRLTGLSTDLDAAMDGYEQSRDFERRLDRQRRRYRLVIAGLTVLSLALLAWVILT